MKRVGVRILLKEEVLDTQGRAVKSTLNNHGMQVGDVQVGKYVILHVEASNDQQATEMAKKMADHFLYNPLIEKYEVEVLK